MGMIKNSDSLIFRDCFIKFVWKMLLTIFEKTAIDKLIWVHIQKIINISIRPINKFKNKKIAKRSVNFAVISSKMYSRVPFFCQKEDTERIKSAISFKQFTMPKILEHTNQQRFNSPHQMQE